MARNSLLDTTKEHIAIYEFALRNPIDGSFDDMTDIFFRQNKLWNALVAIDHADREGYEQLRKDENPEYARLSERIAELGTIIEENLAAKRQLKKSMRTKKVDASSYEQLINSARSERKNADDRIKELRAIIKGAIAQKAKELNVNKEKAIKLAAHQSGLWWRHHEVITDRYRVASTTAKKDKTMLQFHSFTGTGSFCSRLSTSYYQGTTFDNIKNGDAAKIINISAIPDLSIAHLSARGQRHRARHHLTMKIDSNKESGESKTITWPIIFHRDIPADSIIQKVTVHRSRSGNKFEWKAVFDCRDQTPAKPLSEHPSTAQCGIDPGWRLEEDGSLRVATVCHKSNDRFHYSALLLPNDLMNSLDRIKHVTSVLDKEANDAWAALYLLIKDCKGDDPLTVLKQRSIFNAKCSTEKERERNAPDRMMKKMHRYYLNNPEALAADPAQFKILDDWLKKTAKRTQEIKNTRQRTLRRRQHIYRNFAANIVRQYLLIKIENTPLAKLALNKKEPNGDGNVLHKEARNQRQTAALSELFLSIKNAARKSGSHIEWIPPNKTSSICSFCGTDNFEESDNERIWTCKSCDSVHHRDENAARNIYNAVPEGKELTT